MSDDVDFRFGGDPSDLIDSLKDIVTQLQELNSEVHQMSNDMSDSIREGFDTSAIRDDFKELKNGLNDVDQSAKTASSGGLEDMFSSFTDIASAGKVAFNAIKEGVQVLSDLNDEGLKLYHATDALNAFSGGLADTFEKAGRDATGGLIDDITLATDASKALSQGIISNSNDFKRLAADGANLGETLMGSAASGLDAIDKALLQVGNNRSLRALDIDVQAVDADYQKFLSYGIDKQTAWTMAVLNGADAISNKLGNAFQKPGAELEKFSAKLENMKAQFGEGIAIIGDDALKRLEDLGNNGELGTELGLAFRSAFGMGLPPNMIGNGGAMYPNAIQGAQAPIGVAPDKYHPVTLAAPPIISGGSGGDFFGYWAAEIDNAKDKAQQFFSIVQDGITKAQLAAGDNIFKNLMGQANSGLSFDKAALDAYQLATGQVTKEQLAFRDAENQIIDDLKNKKIDSSTAVSQLQSLSQAAKDGKISLQDLWTWMENSDDPTLKMQGIENLAHASITAPGFKTGFSSGDMNVTNKNNTGSAYTQQQDTQLGYNGSQGTTKSIHQAAPTAQTSGDYQGYNRGPDVETVAPQNMGYGTSAQNTSGKNNNVKSAPPAYDSGQWEADVAAAASHGITMPYSTPPTDYGNGARGTSDGHSASTAGTNPYKAVSDGAKDAANQVKALATAQTQTMAHMAQDASKNPFTATTNYANGARQTIDRMGQTDFAGKLMASGQQAANFGGAVIAQAQKVANAIETIPAVRTIILNIQTHVSGSDGKNGK